MKQKAAEYLVDRRNANCLIDILARLDCSEPGSVATAAIMAFKRVFMKVIEKQEIRRNKGMALLKLESFKGSTIFKTNINTKTSI